MLALRSRHYDAYDADADREPRPAHTDLNTARPNTMSDTDLCNVTPIHLIAGHPGMPGVPMLSLALRYDADGRTAKLTGQALIFPAAVSPGGCIIVDNVCGPVHGLGNGKVARTISLKGQYWRPDPAEAAGGILEQFVATFVTDNQWRGHGTFVYGGQPVSNIPVQLA